MPRRRARPAAKRPVKPASGLITPAQQRRSRDTHDAIVDAFRELLASKGFADISVAQIAKRAGSSVGGVYARFASKDALLIPVLDDIIDECTAALDRAMDAMSEPGHTLADVVDAYVGGMVTMFRRHRVAMLHVVRAARGDTARALAERLYRFNLHAHGRFRALAWEHRAEIGHPSPKAAIELALFFGSASGREGILTENWRSYETRPDDATLAKEIGRAMLSYLGAGR